MKVTLDLSEEFVQKMEEKINNNLPDVVELVLEENIDELLRDIVLKQLKSCALIYIQGQDMRQRLLDKVKPIINEMVGIK